MITVKDIIEETTCSTIDENGEFSKAIPIFRETFSKKAKEMWNMFLIPDKFTNKELIDKTNEMIILLYQLKFDVSEHSKHTGEIDDWV